jgi:hypothetical protein
MEENAKKGFAENRIFLIAMIIFILIACAAGASLINLKNAPPAVSGVKITLKENKIILSYRRSDPDGPDKKDSIAWFFNNKQEKEYDGLRLIPVPAVLDATVEVLCSVTAYDGIERSPQVKSNIIKYFQGSRNATDPADAGAGRNGDPEASTVENSANISTAGGDNGSVLSNAAPADNSKNAAGGGFGENIIAAANDNSYGESISSEPEKHPGGGQAPDSAVKAAAAGQSGAADDKNVEPEPLFRNKPAEIFKDNSTKKEPVIFETPFDRAPEEFNSYPPYIPYPPYVPYPPYPQYSGRHRHSRHRPDNRYQPPPVRPSNEVSTVNEDENNHETRLHAAARRDDVYLAAELLKKGADIDARDVNDVTPLHTAILNNSLETARLLINNGADIKARDNNGKTPLHVAARKKSKIIALLLFEKESVTVDKVKNPELVRINRLVNIIDNRGQTALHTAAVFDAGAVASILIDSGADVNARDKTKSTPLHYALLNKSRAVVPLLLTSGADLSAKDEFGQKPEYFADEEMKTWLLPKDTAENSLKKPGK